MLEFLNKAGSIYTKKYFDSRTNSVDTRTWKRENKLIRGIATMERNGFKVDVDYLIKSHYKVEEFRTKLYEKLHKLTESDWSVGQHTEIKKFFESKFGLNMPKTDKKAINSLSHHENPKVSEIARLIIKLRTVDKWLSTYIDGVLNKIIEVDGEWKLYTSLNNNGAISGRVSCDLQQMPKYAINETDDDNELLLDESLNEEGVELFHPRKFVIPSNGYKLYFLDYSQMELRIQAYFTILVNSPDYNLCRAYMPLDCYRVNDYLEIEEFDYKNPQHIKQAYDGSWFNKDNTQWEATDLHTKTTLTAFPEWQGRTNEKEFKKKWRYLGKSTNFAKNYGCGAKTLADNLNVDLETATKLSDAYNSAYPGVIKYQQKVQADLAIMGYVTNLYGRRYYLEKSTNYYKANNYLIQGTGADALKEVEIKICDYLKDKKSRFILPIHDEIAIEVHPDEESYVPKTIKGFMEEVGDVIKWVPMVSEVEMTETSWADKKEVEL
jgi:DNA polymerase-1